MNRCKEHFEKLINRPDPSNPPAVNTNLPIKRDEPMRKEITKVIGQLKMAKKRGLTRTTYQQTALKTDSITLKSMLVLF